MSIEPRVIQNGAEMFGERLGKVREFLAEVGDLGESLETLVQVW